jgi:ribosomal protein L25 (general stress protein Ctc)
VTTATLPSNEIEILEIPTIDRDDSRNPRQLRACGLIPGTVYGKGLTSRNVAVDNHIFKLAYKRGVRKFKLGENGVTAWAHQVQYNPVSFQILNIEFLIKQG